MYIQLLSCTRVRDVLLNAYRLASSSHFYGEGTSSSPAIRIPSFPVPTTAILRGLIEGSMSLDTVGSASWLQEMWISAFPTGAKHFSGRVILGNDVMM